jgi:hypothetical protein
MDQLKKNMSIFSNLVLITLLSAAKFVRSYGNKTIEGFTFSGGAGRGGETCGQE